MEDLIKQLGDIPDELEPCEECNGAGEVEKTFGGDGWPKYDAPVPCVFCNGTGKQLIYEL